MSTTTSSSLVSMSPSYLATLISSGYVGDLSGCLVNCSNHGICYSDPVTNVIGCICDQNFTGSACATDIRACSSSPCLNEGLCIDLFNNQTDSFSYQCNCTQYYSGANCDTKIDICAGQECSNHGTCTDTNHTAVCDCYSNYSGDQCEIESESLKTAKKVIQSTSIIAIITLIMFYLLFVCSDIHTWYVGRNRKRRERKAPKKSVQVGVYKVQYVN